MARPTDEYKDERLNIRLPGRITAAIDDFRASQRPVPGRGEVIRHLIEWGLEAKGVSTAPSDAPPTNRART